MAENITINNLSTIHLNDISTINFDTAYFITGDIGDQRGKIIADKVLAVFPDISVISTNCEKNRYINDPSNQDKLTIIIDVSLIKRAHLAIIFNEIYELSTNREINLYIYYSLAAYTPPDKSDPAPNKRVTSVHPRFMGWDDEQDLNIMTIVGLGYEKEKATGAVEYLESDRSILFIPNSSEEQYLQEVKNQNDYLIQSTKLSDRIEYDVESPVKTIMKIDSIISSCKNRYKPVLLPFGPKIFYACTLLVALSHPNASVWYVSGEDNEKQRPDQDPVSTFGFKCTISVNNI